MQGLPNTAPDGFRIPFAAGHVRRMPRLTARAVPIPSGTPTAFIDVARRYATRAAQAGGHFALGAEPHVSRGGNRRAIRATNSSTICSREHETEVRRCLAKGAHTVQVDFTEGRLAMKIDPSGHLLQQLHRPQQSRAVALLRRRSASASAFIPAPAGICDSTHSADVDYAELLPSLFELKAGNFYVAFAGEPDRARVLQDHPRVHQAGPAGIRWRRRADRSAHRDAGGGPRPGPGGRRDTSRSSSLAPPTIAGSRRSATTTSTSRDTAFAKIRARVPARRSPPSGWGSR